MAPPPPRKKPSKKSGGGAMAPVPEVEKKSSEDPGRSSESGIYRPLPEEPDRVERPAPPEGGEDEEEDDFPGIEKLFEPCEPQPAPPHAPQPAAPAGSEALEPRRIALPLRVKKFHERLLPFNGCWKNCATKWSFTSCM